MKKVQIFAGNDTTDLQLQINKWLGKNKDVQVINTNMDSAILNNKIVYTFYILYDRIGEAALAINTLMNEAAMPAGAESSNIESNTFTPAAKAN
ncbi:MAG: hypothetical protein H0X33_01240 [Taibaiella sp.]|nr:hypothetical protein [Taibaiella sp.]